METPRHVYGHLDKTIPYHLLTWWEKGNLEVDKWAGAYCEQLEAAGHLIAPNPRFFTKLAALYIGNVKQSSLSEATLHLRSRWQLRGVISPEAEAETDWPPTAGSSC